MEKAGILAKGRLERDLQMVTNGKCITLDETQRKLLYCVAEPEIKEIHCEKHKYQMNYLKDEIIL